MAAPGQEVKLKGSEVVTGWKLDKKSGVWSVEIDNSLFGDFNPFALNIYGDWLQQGRDLHLGEVYLNEKALREIVKVEDMADADNCWHATVDDNKTTIMAKFGSANPNKELTEINVRPTCFFPKTTGINYITVKGLNISQAATQWSPPTGEQIGIIGPNWSKGWIIEDCEISNSKCVGVCLGKERASGQNMWVLYRNKFGYSKCGFNREIEAIFKAHKLGWSKETIGSHLVQNNKIHSCGQAGIVGHMGAAFSTIRHNEIIDINQTEGLNGAETAGIKLHAAIDAVLEGNVIVNTKMGIWLDWQAQGTQVMNNVIAESREQDLFIEVSHGPTLIYNNILLSDLNLLVTAQGIAFCNNLLWGRNQLGGSPERYTPYHQPHSTDIMGLFNNTGGDLRFYNNLSLGNAPREGKGANGLSRFSSLPIYSDTLSNSIKSTPDYVAAKFPVWTGGNVHYSGSDQCKNEADVNNFSDENPTARLERREDGYYLIHTIDTKRLQEAKSVAINTEMLGHTFISEAIFENADETPFTLNSDIFGNERNAESPTPGVFEGEVASEVAVWLY